MASASPPTHLDLAGVDARALTDLISASFDLTIVVDGENVVGDLWHNLENVPAPSISSWQGQRIDDVVNGNSLPALQAMLLSARSARPANGYEIAHRLANGDELPVKYSASPIGGQGQVVLVGRDLRPIASLQSRLLANRQSLDLNKRRQRQSETRYRLLFETMSDAVIVVDAASGTIREANPRAAALLDWQPSELVGMQLASAFGKSRRPVVKEMLARAAAAGAAAALALEADGERPGLSVSAELIRSDDMNVVLVRLSALDADPRPEASLDAGLSNLVRDASEAVVLTDESGKVQWVNESFLSLAGIPLAAQVVGQPLETLLQWHGIEQGVVFDRVRKLGRMPMVSGTVRARDGRASDVETSVVARSDARDPGFALVMRRASESGQGSASSGDTARLPDGFIDMVGRVPMKDLVRDTTDMIERMCIEAALKLAGNNRASAARALGLSRQALYLKLRRFGIAEDE